MTAATHFVTRIIEELGPAPTPHTLVAALIPEVADSCLLFCREARRYRLCAWGHISAAKSALLEELAAIHQPAVDDPRDPVAAVGRSGEGVLVPCVTREHIERATDDPRMHALFDAFGPRNIVIVPIRNGDYVMVTAISDSPRKLLVDDLEFLTELAGRVAPLLP